MSLSCSLDRYMNWIDHHYGANVVVARKFAMQLLKKENKEGTTAVE